MAKATTEVRWILPSEAGRILGVSAGYVRQLVDTHRLSGRRGPLGIRFIDREAVVEFAGVRRVRQTKTRGSDRELAGRQV